MTESWLAIALGWPAIFLAIGLTIAAIFRRRWLWPMAAALIAMPITVYLAGSPAYGWLALCLSPMLAIAGIALRYHRATLAWLCLVPFIAVTGWIAFVVANQ